MTTGTQGFPGAEFRDAPGLNLCLDPMVGFRASARVAFKQLKTITKKVKDSMKTQYTISLWALALVLLSGGTLLADPFMSSLQIGPQTPAPIGPGSSASYTITVTKTNSGPMDIFLSAFGLPQGATASFSPNQIEFASNTVSGTATMVITTTNSILPGSYPFSVWGNDGHSPNTMTNTTTLNVSLGSPGLMQIANDCWCFAFAAQPGQSYLIQATTNLYSASWTTLCTTNSGTNSLLVFVDRDETHYPCRFYRALAQ